MIGLSMKSKADETKEALTDGCPSADGLRIEPRKGRSVTGKRNA
jgi:hypothetical protein